MGTFTSKHQIICDKKNLTLQKSNGINIITFVDDTFGVITISLDKLNISVQEDRFYAYDKLIIPTTRTREFCYCECDDLPNFSSYLVTNVDGILKYNLINTHSNKSSNLSACEYYKHKGTFYKQRIINTRLIITCNTNRHITENNNLIKNKLYKSSNLTSLEHKKDTRIHMNKKHIEKFLSFFTKSPTDRFSVKIKPTLIHAPYINKSFIKYESVECTLPQDFETVPIAVPIYQTIA